MGHTILKSWNGGYLGYVTHVIKLFMVTKHELLEFHVNFELAWW